jgi:hypothetical protein
MCSAAMPYGIVGVESVSIRRASCRRLMGKTPQHAPNNSFARSPNDSGNVILLDVGCTGAHQGRGADFQIWMIGVALALVPEWESP